MNKHPEIGDLLMLPPSTFNVFRDVQLVSIHSKPSVYHFSWFATPCVRDESTYVIYLGTITKSFYGHAVNSVVTRWPIVLMSGKIVILTQIHDKECGHELFRNLRNGPLADVAVFQGM